MIKAWLDKHPVIAAGAWITGLLVIAFGMFVVVLFYG
jgi:hypothetical protein